MLNLNKNELQLLESVLLMVVKNGNHVDGEAFVPNREDYVNSCKILQKVGNDMPDNKRR